MNRQIDDGWTYFWGIFFALCAIAYIVGNYAYWIVGWGHDNLLMAGLITLWPFIVLAGCSPALYAQWRYGWVTKYPGDVLMVMLTYPYWLVLLYAWNEGFLGQPPDQAIGYLIGYGYPIFMVTIWGKRHPDGFMEVARWLGNTLNRHYKTILGIGIVITVIAFFIGIMQMSWAPFWIVILTPISLVCANMIRNLLMGFTDRGMAGFVDGEIRPVEYYDRSLAAPQHIHPIGIWLTAVERAKIWTFEVLPGRTWLAFLPFRLGLMLLGAWLMLDPIAYIVGSTRFPPFPFELSLEWIAALEITTLVFVLFLGKKIRPGWMIITLPIWSIAALDAAAIIWGNDRIFLFWFFTWIPHIYYAAAVWSRTMFGFTVDYKIFVTTCRFHWWGLTTPKRSGDIHDFKQDTIEISDFGPWTYGSFDPALLKFGAEELIVATHLPHPEKFRWALLRLQQEVV